MLQINILRRRLGTTDLYFCVMYLSYPDQYPVTHLHLYKKLLLFLNIPMSSWELSSRKFQVASSVQAKPASIEWLYLVSHQTLSLIHI